MSTRDNKKLLKQLESSFERTINWNKFHFNKTYQAWNRYLNFLVVPCFQGVNRLFVLSFESDVYQKSYKQYYLPTVEIKDYNVVIDSRNLFNNLINNKIIKNYLKTNDNIRKTATGQGDDYITGCLLDYPFFKKYYKLIAMDLSQQQTLDANPNAMQQMTFTGNLTREEGGRIYFIIEEAKETVLGFSKGTVKVLWFYFVLIKY